MAELKMCECGEPTYANKCALCSADESMFPPPTRPAPPMPKIKPPRTGPYQSDMTMRDEFALAALTGMLATPHGYPFEDADDFAAAAYRYADAMLEARNANR